MHEKRPEADRESCTIRAGLDVLQNKSLKGIVTMPSIRRFFFAILIASLGVAAITGRVVAEEAKGSGQPSNQIGLEKARTVNGTFASDCRVTVGP